MTGLPGMPQETETNNIEQDDSDKSMSLLSGVAGGGDDDLAGVIVDEPVSKGQSPWVQTIILLAIVLAMSAGALYFMRTTQEGMETRGTGDLASRIDDALGRLTNTSVMSADDPYSKSSVDDLFSDTDRVLAIFASDPAEKQIPIEFIKKNPFSIRVERIIESPGDQTQSVDLEARKVLTRLGSAYRQLRLQSVVDMRVPVAVINGDMYRSGDTIGEFYVEAISSKHQAVKLTAGGRDWVLRMQLEGR